MALPVHERERSTEKYSEVGAARRRRRASSSLRPTPRRILTIDRNDGRWKVEARRGHGPHGRGRRRVRCPTGRTCGRWRVTTILWSPCRLRRRRFTPLVVPASGATNDCALSLTYRCFCLRSLLPDITVGFSLPGSRGCAGTTKPPRRDLAPSLDCHVGDGHGGGMGK